MPERTFARRAAWVVALLIACGVAAAVGFSRRERRDPSAVFEPGVCAVSDLAATTGFRAVPCSNPHDAEVVLVKPWPSRSRLGPGKAGAECFSTVPELIQSRYSRLGAVPAAITSASGRLVCLVVHPSRSTSIVAEVAG